MSAAGRIQQPRPVGEPRPAALQDTLGALPQDTTTALPIPSLRLGLATRPLPYPVDLLSRLPNPELQRPELRSRVRDWGSLWQEAVDRRLTAQRSELWLQSRPAAKGDELANQPDIQIAAVPSDAPPVQVEPRPPALPDQAPTDTLVTAPPGPAEAGILPDAFSQYTDLGMIIQGRVELGGGWNRTRPCSVSIQLSCNARIIPDLQPDIQFGARVGGTISDRIHVSVDYDNRREFDAANNINVFYQGLADEIIQRVEVGDVSFPLPQSRFLTQGIPAGNFGFRGTGQMGPLDFQMIWAQQKGDLGTRELQLGGGGQGFEQDATTVLDDADYENGRFFFLFTPTRFADYPHIDIQRLIAVDAPPDVRPESAIKLYRYEGATSGAANQIPEGFITAVASAVDTLQTAAGADTVVTDTVTGLFRPLAEGDDYILHQSGTWVILRNTIPRNQALAVTYLASDGSEVGDFNAEELSDAHSADPDNVPPPRLELIKGFNQRPGTATWRREMHQVYRVSGSPGVVTSSIELIISQGDPEIGDTFAEADGTQVEFLQIFGLDNNPTDNRVDAAVFFEAKGTGADATAAPAGTYVILPTLEPFKLPPPLINTAPSLDGQPFPLLAGDRNAAIYDETNDQIRRGSNLYLLTIRYRQRFEGFVSTISLGAGAVREGSERVFIEDQELVRGEDYTIDYDVGVIELREPDRWFRNSTNAKVRVSFEQKPLFQLAPTSVFGLQAAYDLGGKGVLNFIGLSQNEKTLATRPELGLEPASVQLGGISGRLDFEPSWLTRLVNALPGITTDAASAISVDAEVAVSLPTTNTQGETYLEDFEGGTGFGIALLSRAWRLGSAPSTSAGAEAIAPPIFDEPNAAELVWQDQYTVVVDGSTQLVGGLSPADIDPALATQSNITRAEPVLWVTARNPEDATLAPSPTPVVGSAWRSITANLSLNGLDFTTIEFLEFYIGVSNVLADSVDLIIDLGTVSEDAFALDSLRNPSGSGRLDREVIPPQVWSNNDDTGLWNSGCEADPGVITYPLADVRANCTRMNGLEDTEDLNQNSILDTDERFFRYTIDIGNPNSRYFVRNANSFAGLQFKLFRVPLLVPDHRERVTDAEFQNIKHMRFTWVTRGNVLAVLARTRFLGSRFLKRGEAGIVAGLADTVSASPPAGTSVGPISTLDDRYVSPPGITDQGASISDEFALDQQQINEQSLSIAFAELPPDSRAEVYLQYVQTPRNLLEYRRLRVWAMGIDGPWGLEGSPLRFLVKLGEDATNYYLYKTPLRQIPPDAVDEELRQLWLPEVLIDLNRFIALRTRAEQIFFQGQVPEDSALQVWDVDVFEDGDSTYAVFISQRSRPPNLAAVRQISLGVYNGGTTSVPLGRLWVDDIRLDAAEDQMGVVGMVNLDLRASDILSFNLSYSSQNPYFRQLAANPSFVSSDQLRAGGRLEFGRFLPNAWGIRMPINVRYSNAESKPTLLPSTDVFTQGLEGLRSPSSKDLRLDVSLSRQARTNVAGIGWLVDNSALRFTLDDRNWRTSRSTSESSNFTAGYSFRSGVSDLSFPIFKPFIFLPRSIRDSRFRITPQRLQFGASYLDSETLTRRFQDIVQLPSDSAAVPIRTLDERLLNNLVLDLAPFSSITGRFSVSQDRELVPTDELALGDAAARLIEAERESLAGIDIGWLRGRSVNTNLSFRPNISNWFTLQASASTRFRFNRAASYVQQVDADTVLSANFSNGRSSRTSVGFNLPIFLRSLAGRNRGGMLGVLLGVTDWIDIFTATWDNSVNSNYDRGLGNPNFGYQLGLGSFKSLLVVDGDSASRVAKNSSINLTSGLLFPFGLAVNVDYTDGDGNAFTPANQTRAVNRTWPSFSVNWNRIPLPPFLSPFISTFGVRTGYSVRTSAREILAANQDRTSRSESLPLNLTLSTTGGWSLTYAYDLTKDERRDATGATFGDATRHAFSLSGQIRLPENSKTFKNPLRINLRISQSNRAQCRQLGAGTLTQPPDAGDLPECQPFTDLRIRRIDLTADTDVQPFILGLQGSWRDTQSVLGQRPGNTQLEISVFGQFRLETGEIR